MRLIDANAVEAGFKELCQSPYFKVDVNAKHGAETLMDLCVRTDSHKPNTIDPETLPIVQQLRKKIKNLNAGIENLSKIIKNAYEKRDEFKEKLESVTAELDGYKIFFNNVTAFGDCNDCGNLKTCKYKPRIGETTCFNCPLWRNKVELPACGDIISAVKAAEKIAFAKQTSIPRDQWQDAAEVME